MAISDSATTMYQTAKGKERIAKAKGGTATVSKWIAKAKEGTAKVKVGKAKAKELYSTSEDAGICLD